jgi:adenylate cyclase
MTRPLAVLYSELKRRRVFRVAVVYGAVAFVVVQAADIAFPALQLPDWTVTLVVVLALLGLPIALVLAWAFEMTPAGVVRTAVADAAATAPSGAASPGGADAAPSGSPAAPRPARRAAWFVLGLLVAGTLGWYGVARVGGGDAHGLDAGVVAVVPFRVAGADPSLAYLREGMVDLLAAKLTGEWGPQAVDPRTLMSAWRRAVPREDEDLPADGAAALGRELGAGQVLLGELVSASGGLVITASLVDSRTGRVGTPATVEGPLEALPALVDRLTATMLTRAAGEADHRLAGLTSTSLTALRAYLRARSDYRVGRFDQALDGFVQAMTEDSTFALAAMGAHRAGGWAIRADFDGPAAMARAWRHRDRLSGRDRAVLEAMAGVRYPAPSSARERLEAWERVVQVSPDDAEAWYEVGDVLFHYYRLFDDGALDRAMRAFQRSHDLDPDFTPAQLHLFDGAVLRGDGETAARIAREHLATDTSGMYAFSMLAALAWHDGEAGSSPRVMDLVERTDHVGTLVVMTFALPVSEFPAGMADILLPATEVAATRARARATTLQERRMVAQQTRQLALNYGQTARALRITRELAELDGDPLLEARLNVLAGLHWDGDPDAASRGAEQLAAALARAGTPMAMAASDGGGAHLCALAQWRLARGDGASAAALAEAIRWAPEDRVARSAETACALVVEAWSAHLEGRPDAADRVRRLNTLLGDGAPAGEMAMPANLVLARILEDRGDIEGAYRAARRRVALPGGEAYGTTGLREEGRLAARLGWHDVAEQAYLMYLRFHRDPDPGPAADAAETVRRALAERIEAR